MESETCPIMVITYIETIILAEVRGHITYIIANWDLIHDAWSQLLCSQLYCIWVCPETWDPTVSANPDEERGILRGVEEKS